MRERFEANLRALSAAGVTVTELAMPAAFDTMGEAQDVIMAYDLAREADRLPDDGRGAVGRRLRWRARRGGRLPPRLLRRGARRRHGRDAVHAG
ncbi:hypothetical protein G6F24_016469 [Rhizopus arrhizus]|nr:hypothetical protein G6F24_016469 [Rhizopus arrhizus]